MVLEGLRQMSLQQFDIPRIGEEDGLLRLEMCGVCGSDVGIFTGKATRAQQYFPIILGHEILGRVEERGEKASLRHGFRKRDRVVVEYSFGCEYCRHCLKGKYIFCENGGKYEASISCQILPHLWGAYGEYLYLRCFGGHGGMKPTSHFGIL